MKYLYLVVFEAALLEVVLDEVDYFGEDFDGVAGVGADAGYADGSALPVIVVAYLGGGDVELVDDAGEDGLEVLSLILEGVVLRQVKRYAGCADDHGEVLRRVVRETSLTRAWGVSQILLNLLKRLKGGMKRGGTERIRTAGRAFAELCLATWPRCRTSDQL
jgi:hypothetical protein